MKHFQALFSKQMFPSCCEHNGLVFITILLLGNIPCISQRNLWEMARIVEEMRKQVYFRWLWPNMLLRYSSRPNISILVCPLLIEVEANNAQVWPPRTAECGHSTHRADGGEKVLRITINTTTHYILTLQLQILT